MTNTIESCFMNFYEHSNNPKAICNRINDTQIQTMTYQIQKVKKDKLEKETKERVFSKRVFDTFYQKELLSYQGELYEIVDTMYQCLDILINTFQKDSYLDEFKKFYHSWRNYMNKRELFYKCQVQHSLNKLFKNIYKNDRYYLDTSYLNLIERFHQENIDNDSYRKLKHYYHQNKLRYYSPKTVNPINKTYDTPINSSKDEKLLTSITNTTIENSDMGGWESVPSKKNKKKQKKVPSLNNTDKPKTNDTTTSTPISPMVQSNNTITDLEDTHYNDCQELETILDDTAMNNNSSIPSYDLDNGLLNHFNKGLTNNLHNDDIGIGNGIGIGNCIENDGITEHLSMIEPNLDFIDYLDLGTDYQRDDNYSSDEKDDYH